MPTRTALVYGAAGALGRATVDAFRRRNWQTLACDFFDHPNASANIVLTQSASVMAQSAQVLEVLQKKASGRSLDAVVCVSGGWAGGNLEDPGALYENTANMLSSSLYASLIASHLASKHLKEGGSLLLPGAAAALGGTAASTPGMIPYGVAKAAVHQLLASLSQREAAGLPAGCRVFAIAPITLDTPGNRHGMPNADFSSWTPLPELAEQIERWCDRTDAAESGAGQAAEHGVIYEVITEKGKTRYAPHK